MPATETTPLISQPATTTESSILRRPWHIMSTMISPFSARALASLPKIPLAFQERSTRTDRIPDTSNTEGSLHYDAINHTLSPGVRVPKKIATPIRVEAKVWFANERTWMAYTNLGILLGTLSVALFNGSHDEISRNFGYAYALISCGVMIYGYCIYQKRITMIKKRDPGHFGQIWGPVTISALLFIAVAANFYIRLREFKKSHTDPEPGALQGNKKY